MSVHPLPSVTTNCKECVRLVSPKGTEGSLKVVFKFSSFENELPSTSHSYAIGLRPSDVFDVMILPPLQMTFCTEKKALGSVIVIGMDAGVDWQPNSSVAVSCA